MEVHSLYCLPSLRTAGLYLVTRYSNIADISEKQILFGLCGATQTALATTTEGPVLADRSRREADATGAQAAGHERQLSSNLFVRAGRVHRFNQAPCQDVD